MNRCLHVFCALLLVGARAAAETRDLAEFIVGPAPVAARNWPVETTLNLEELASAAKNDGPLDKGRLELVEIAAGKTAPTPLVSKPRPGGMGRLPKSKCDGTSAR